jgi:peroxiredoxin
MVLSTTNPMGWKATDFALKGIDGKTYSLADVRGPNGTLVVFICNHCPYVKASIDRIAAEAQALREIGIGTIAIMPNDTETYAEDSFDNMKAFAARHRFTFPYVIDTTQDVARAFDAQCTPDFFGFNVQDELQYRGRLDASRMTPVPKAQQLRCPVFRDRQLAKAIRNVIESVVAPLGFASNEVVQSPRSALLPWGRTTHHAEDQQIDWLRHFGPSVGISVSVGPSYLRSRGVPSLPLDVKLRQNQRLQPIRRFGNGRIVQPRPAQRWRNNNEFLLAEPLNAIAQLPRSAAVDVAEPIMPAARRR